jgi:site-specific DNA-methyltransferase (adenine-specific)
MITVKTPADGFVLYGADCLDILRMLPADSVDSIVTDPPAGIAFMGKDWDKDKGGRDAWIAWMQEVAVECLRVVKPGGHALVWALPRTSHWTGMAWENAGWEPRDKITHLFGSGMPKSHNVSKTIDKAAGAERQVIATKPAGSGPLKRGHVNSSGGGMSIGTERSPEIKVTVAATENAKRWEGWGTALKPSSEDWWLLRKPLSGTVAANVLAHGTGALNIDGCRVPYQDGEVNFDRKQRQQNSDGAIEGAFGAASLIGTEIDTYKESGRWPANTVIDDSAEVTANFPADGKGPLSRFFYCAKASTADRDEGLEHLPEVQGAGFPMRSAGGERGGEGLDGTSTDRLTKRRNIHPTVKSTDLMRFLTRLVTPNGGVCLDPFMGSGSTGKACALEGFRFIGIEQELAYLDIAEGRIRHAAQNKGAAASEGENSD